MSLCKIASIVGAKAKTYFGNRIFDSVTNSVTGFFFRQSSQRPFIPSRPTLYDCRKYSYNIPSNSVIPPFQSLYCFPTGIFRCSHGEILGPGASKGAQYKNPEYFSYHNMTFHDLDLLMRCFRLCSADSKRKPN